MDVHKQIEYWSTGAQEDFAAAEVLLDKGHLRQGLFFVHLAIEKMLKAHVARHTKDIPPRIHNLVRLTELAGLKPQQSHLNFLQKFGLYQLEGRYPDVAQVVIDAGTAREKLASAREILNWLKAQL